MVRFVFRYFFNFPIGWTSELSVIAWLWLCSGRCLRREESEKSASTSSMGRRAPARAESMGIITGLSIVILYAASLPQRSIRKFHEG